MLKIICALLFTSAFLFFQQDAFAARGMTISADKSALFGDEEMTVTTSLSGFTDGELIYIKGAFYQEGTNSYFGYTKNNDEWVKNGASTTTQRQVKIGDWDGKLTVKSDFADSGFKGEGDYKLKIGFYYTSSSGNLQPVSWSSNSLDVSVSEPDPSPSPTSESQSAPSPSPTPTKASSPSPSPAKSPTPTPKLQSPSPKQSPQSTPQVLGLKEENSSPSPSPTPENESGKSTLKVAGILTGAGSILIALSIGFYLWYSKVFNKPKNIQENSNEPPANGS